MKFSYMFPIAVMISGCTSVNVIEVSASHNIEHVCIEENSKVIVPGFLSTIEDGLNDRSISTEMYRGALPEHCDYKLTYTALQSWDVTPYLTHAELRLYKSGERIGYGEYHHNGGSASLSLNKWASVKSKMTPVINKLFSQH